ncbi:MAG: hypothetical protein JO104_04155 [Candidatus Eremiobacteraeota bacterium]|nr:hypothetical protein [Candidatus Eremiobacteraeota bacterium]
MVKKPVRSIVAAIAAAARRWTDPAFAPRRRARDAVGERTGYSLPSVDFAFDALFDALRHDAIEAVIADELGELDVLDRWTRRGNGASRRALPLGRICIVSSRTTIGVAIVPAIFALCAKCNILVKDRDDHLVAAFFATLREELPELSEAAHAQTWGGTREMRALSGFDGVVAFGNDATLKEIAGSLPFETRFIPYGTRATAGYVIREALQSEPEARAIARDAARALVLYESEGCLSLHALFVERGGAISTARFAELFADAVRAAALEFPPGGPDAAAAMRRAAARDLATFRGAGALYSDSTATCLTILDPPCEAPPLFLPLAIGVHSIERPHQAAAYLERHGIAIEALGVARSRPDLLELAAAIGAARVVPFDALQMPPLAALHGGRPRIAEFVRWVVEET